jgi:2-keto-4-pentenoate hydratase
MTGTDEQKAMQAANLLLDARRTGVTLSDLPTELQPQTLEQVYAVQDLVAAAYGEIGGWKIGAPTPDATPLYAPMPAAWMAADGVTLAGEQWRYRGLEAEIAFLVGTDLLPRATPYTRDEVLDAMASCHPAIEELESAYTDPPAATKFCMFADLQMHGGFIHGPAFAEWRTFDFTQERVVLSVDGAVRVDRVGSNTSGDFFRLLVYLANEGAARTGGLRAGQWITTGSWTGNTLASAGSAVEVEFAHAGTVRLRFA